MSNYQVIYNRLTGKGLTLATLEKLAALVGCEPYMLITPEKQEKTPPDHPILICPHCGKIIYISAHIHEPSTQGSEQTQENTPQNVSETLDTLF